MITIITGVPGSGKTLYAISKLIQPLVGTHVPQEVDGVTTLHPRTIYTNINGLILDHELIDGGDKQGLRDWHTWAKPGAVIVFDEVQKIWKPRANGSLVPDDIQALETHRHMGVDFILLTQGPMLIDRNLHVLCGRHLHVRRIANMAAAIVYEWDLFSRTLNFKNSVTKSPWKYDKKIYKLYQSAQLHTKQKRSLPGVLWFLLIAVGLLAWKGPIVYKGLTEKPVIATANATTKKPVASAPAAPAPVPVPAASPQLVAVAPAKPKLLGCIQMKNRCSCFDQAGDLVDMELQICKDETSALKRIETGSGTYTPAVPAPVAAVAVNPASAPPRSVDVPNFPKPQYNQADLVADWNKTRTPGVP